MKYLTRLIAFLVGCSLIISLSAFSYSCPAAKDIIFQKGTWLILGPDQKLFEIIQAPKTGDPTVIFSKATAATPFAAEDVAAKIDCSYQTKPGVIVTEAQQTNFPAQCFILNLNWFYGDTNSNCKLNDPLQCQFTLASDGRCHS